MASYKEIVTKAVIGKGKKHYVNKYSVNTDNTVNTVLGCWIINHNFRGEKESNNTVILDGTYDVNIWYSYDNDTKTSVITKTISYREVVNVNLKDKTDTVVQDVIVRSLKQPTCINAKEDGKKINIEIEKELGVEIVGDVKVKIAIEEDDDNWDILEDNYNKDTEKEIENNVDENYLKD